MNISRGRRSAALGRLGCAIPLLLLVSSQLGVGELRGEIHSIIMHRRAKKPGSVLPEKASEQRAGSSWTQLDPERQPSRK